MSENKHICMILRDFYPTDIRVHKEAKSLLSTGYRVTLICLKRKNESKNVVIDGINVIRVNAGYSKWTIGLWDIFISIFKIHYVFFSAMNNVHRLESIDVLHVHDLYLMPTSMRFAKKKKIFLVGDFHENLPEAFKVWFQWNNNLLKKIKNKMFFGYKKWINIEKKAAKNCDMVFVTVDEMKNRFVEKLKIEPKKIKVVLNSELKEFTNQPLDMNIYGGDNWFRVTYTGNIGPHRGVDTAIKAMQFLKGKPICLHIIGKCNKDVGKYLDDLIIRNGLEESVKRTGYVPFEKFFSYMKFAQVNIIPHKSNEHTNNTIPHKLFQAMMTGNPVLVSSSPPLKRIVNSCNSGLIFEANNPEDLANKLNTLLTDMSLCKSLGKNGLNSTLQGEWNWEHTQKVMLEAYNNLFLK